MMRSFSKAWKSRTGGLNKLAPGEDLTLDLIQYMLIGLYRQLHPLVLLHYCYSMVRVNPGIIFLMYMIGTFFVGVPLNVTFALLGEYTKMKILRIFTCVPYIKGLGYVLLLSQNVVMVLNHYVLTHQTYFYFYEDMKFLNMEPLWENCEFEEAEANCLPMNKTFTCEEGKSYELSFTQFSRVAIFKYNNYHVTSPAGPPSLGQLLLNAVLWLVFMLLAYVGLQRSLKLQMLLLMCDSIFMSALTGLVIYNWTQNVAIPLQKIFDSQGEENGQGLYDIALWATILVSSSGIFELTSTIWLGAHIPADASATLTTTAIFVGKLLIILAYTLNLRLSTDYRSVKNTFPGCTIIYGVFTKTVIFVYLLMSFDENVFWAIAVAVFSGLKCVIDNIFLGSILVDSLVDRFPRCHRFWVCLLLYTSNALASIALVAPINTTIMGLWFDVIVSALGIIMLFFVTACFTYFYPIAVIADNYYFISGKYFPKVIQSAFARLFIVAAFFLFGIFYWIAIVSQNNLKNWCLGALLIFFLPWLLTLFFSCLDALNKDATLVTCNNQWGLTHTKSSRRRSFYLPERNIMYRHTEVSCTHKCLHKAEGFEKELYTQHLKYNEAARQVLEQD